MIKNKLKVLRAENNLSQEELADKVNVSRQAINAIEAYRYKPSLELAFKISKVFGKTLEEIFEYMEEE